MPWLGDGTWVPDARQARDIIHGRTNYRPWSHDLSTATPNQRARDDDDDDFDDDDDDFDDVAHFDDDITCGYQDDADEEDD